METCPYCIRRPPQPLVEALVEIAHWLGLGMLAYAIGSIPTAWLFARYALGRDIRAVGDYNSGAANVFREVGPKAGLACGAIDIIKGGWPGPAPWQGTTGRCTCGSVGGGARQ